jgi:hypothetical protein
MWGDHPALCSQAHSSIASAERADGFHAPAVLKKRMRRMAKGDFWVGCLPSQEGFDDDLMISVDLWRTYGTNYN